MPSGWTRGPSRMMKLKYASCGVRDLDDEGLSYPPLPLEGRVSKRWRHLRDERAGSVEVGGVDLKAFREFVKLREWQRGRDDVALPFLHAAGNQRGHLIGGFDTLGDHGHFQFARQSHKHLHDRNRRRLARNGIDEDFVDLDGVGAKALDQRETAVPDADVVDGDPKAELA
jgi:hypothetical protein